MNDAQEFSLHLSDVEFALKAMAELLDRPPHIVRPSVEVSVDHVLKPPLSGARRHRDGKSGTRD